MTKPHVFVTRVIPQPGIRLLRQTCDVDVWDGELPPPPAILRERIQQADGLLCLLTDKIDAQTIADSPRLRAISTMSVGYDNIDIASMTARRIPIGYTPDVLTASTADCAFALLMAAARRIPEGIEYVRAGKWVTWEPIGLLGQDIHDATLGLIGLGRIGAEMARRARGFNMRIIYNSQSQHQELEKLIGMEYVSLPQLLRESDFVSIHLPLTAATRGLLSYEDFQMMKPNAILINTSRGGIIDTTALVDALHQGLIAGAALDVTDPEPLPMDHPLAHLPNCIVVPHIASASERTRNEMSLIAARNLLAALQGLPMPFCVNPEAETSI